MNGGEEIPALNEPWTLLGAKITEWVSGITMGFLTLIVFEEFLGIRGARAMPVLLIIGVSTTVTLASIRLKFLDEERGIMYKVMDKAGFPPPGIPKPASMQPYWSGARAPWVKETSNFYKLDLIDVVNYKEEEQEQLLKRK
jgi:hypothetical protein